MAWEDGYCPAPKDLKWDQRNATWKTDGASKQAVEGKIGGNESTQKQCHAKG